MEIILENDVLKIDGNFAIAWSGSLEFTVERSGKSLIGSAASGEGTGQRLPGQRQGADDAHRQNAQHLIGPAVALLFSQKGAGDLASSAFSFFIHPYAIFRLAFKGRSIRSTDLLAKTGLLCR